MGIIYCCTNLINNKKYIGKTTRTLEERKAEHFKCLNGKEIFHLALKQFGVKNFSWTILGEYPDEQLNKWEQYWIDQYKTYFLFDLGYNMTFGGEGLSGNGKRVRAYKIEFGNEIYYKDYKTELDAAIDLNIDNVIVSKICNGKDNFYSCHGYTFKFLDEDNNPIPTGYINKKTQNIIGSQPIVVSKNGIITTYNSMNQASKALHIGRDTIRNYLNTNQEYKGIRFFKLNS